MKCRIAIMLLAALLPLIASAQNFKVTGQVLSEQDKEPLIGAPVRIKGTSKAVVTDIDGRFTLSGLTAADKTLEVSYVGFDAQELKLKPENADLTILLKPKKELLDEVIVVAFGKQKREAFTGSASVVGEKEIEKMTLNNPIEALNGTVTGLNMTMANSLTEQPTMTIRGIGSLNASTSPLIVVDGLPYNGSYNDINPAEVASITVLKDAASNALYGARGANGVILITTKSAKRGKTNVTLDMKWGANTDGRIQYDLIREPGQYYETYYMAMRNYYQNAAGLSPYDAHIQANNTMAGTGTGGLGYIVYDVPQGQTLIGSNGKLNPNATLGNRVAYGGNIYTLYPDDWTEYGLRNGFRQEYNLNLTGGNDQFTFLGNVSYLENQGLAYGSDIDRFTSRLKAEYQAFNWLRVGGNAKYSKYNTSTTGNVYGIFTSIAPIYPLFIRDGNGNIMRDSHGLMYDYGDGDNAGLIRYSYQTDNPVQDDLLDTYKTDSNNFQMQGFATAEIPGGFTLTINGSTYITDKRTNIANAPYYGWYLETGGSTEVYHSRKQSFNYQQLLQWARGFGNNNIDILVGHEFSRDKYKLLEGGKTKIADYSSNIELDGAVVDEFIYSYTTDYNVEGVFIRAQYDYDNRIFGSASYRRDGSTRFAKGHQWGNFWSVGGAWIITKESWFPENPYLNMLKIKASYGEQGNDGIGNYRYIDTYNITSVNGEVAYNFKSKGNPNITWETVGSFNTGVEFDLFNGRLGGGVEFYMRDTRDMLMQYPAPTSLGYYYYYDNVGDMRNTGVELQLNGSIIKTKNVSWDLGLNFTWEKNRVTRLPDARKGNEMEGYKGYNNSYTFIAEGLPVYTWRLKTYAGVDPETGNSLFWKTDKNGNKVTTTEIDNADYYLCGSALPDYFGGFNTTLRVFGFDLSAQFNYSIGGWKMDGMYNILMTPPYLSSIGKGIHKDVLNSWSPSNTDSNIPIYQYNNQSAGEYTDRWLTDASFLSLRNINLGYTFPKKWIKKIGLQNLRIYFTGENLYYWSRRKGFDPRTGTQNGNESDGGNYDYPMRSFTGGVQVTF